MSYELSRILSEILLNFIFILSVVPTYLFIYPFFHYEHILLLRSEIVDLSDDSRKHNKIILISKMLNLGNNSRNQYYDWKNKKILNLKTLTVSNEIQIFSSETTSLLYSMYFHIRNVICEPQRTNFVQFFSSWKRNFKHKNFLKPDWEKWVGGETLKK